MLGLIKGKETGSMGGMMVNLEAHQQRQLRTGCVRYGTGLQSEILEKMDK